jgi:large subunit ribosomal protein L25
MAKSERVSTLTLQQRSGVGTTSAKAVRRAGQIPGVLFGHGTDPVPIAVDAKALSILITSGGQSRIVDATLGGSHESVLLRELQRHPITYRPITADFQRVSQTEEILASVAVVTVGVAVGVKESDGIMDLVTHVLEIKGPAGRIPEHLEIDVTSLGIGDHITAGDVPLPAGFTLVTARETAVVSIETARANAVEVEPVAAAAAEAAPAAES